MTGCEGCGANFLKGHQCFCSDECSCFQKGSQWKYRRWPSNRECRQHPTCPNDHAEKTLGLWRFPETIELGGLIKTNGQLEFRVRCLGCGTESPGIGNANFRRLLARGVSYSWTRGKYAKNDSHLCQVRGCTATDVEWHHFAPRNTFLSEADDWPYLPLCRRHHRYWHQMMDGYRWNSKAPQLNTAQPQHS